MHKCFTCIYIYTWIYKTLACYSLQLHFTSMIFDATCPPDSSVARERPAPVLQALPRGDVASVPLAGASICDPNWCSGRSLWTEKKY